MTHYLFLGSGAISTRLIQSFETKKADFQASVFSGRTKKRESGNVKYSHNWQEIDVESVDVIINSWKTLDEHSNSLRDTILMDISQKAKKLERFINLSSVAVYGSNDNPVNESSIANPLNSYGRSKLQIEEKLRTLDLAICHNLRISNVFGDNKSQDVLNLIFQALLNSEKLEIDSPKEVIRDFMPIDQLVSSINMLLSLPSSKFDRGFMTINVGSGQSISLAQVIKILESVTQRKLNFSTQKPHGDTILQSRVSVELLNSLLEPNSHDISLEIRNYFSGKLSERFNF